MTYSTVLLALLAICAVGLIFQRWFWIVGGVVGALAAAIAALACLFGGQFVTFLGFLVVAGAGLFVAGIALSTR